MAIPSFVCVLLALAAVQGGPRIEASLAWDGAFSTATLTELRVGVSSGRQTEVRIEAGARSPVVAAVLKLPHGEQKTAWLPVEIDGPGDVSLRYSVDGGRWTEINAGRLERGAGRIILAGAAAIDRLGDVAGTTTVSPHDLPRLPAAYGHVAALVLGQDALVRLDEAQLLALLEHVGLCGRVLLIDPSQDAARLMRQRAACGSRYLLDASADDNAGRALQTLMSSGAPQLPGKRALGKLQNDRDANLGLMSLYLGGFLIIFVTLIAMPRSRIAGLAVSVLATALAGLLWSVDNRQSFVAWAEVSATERVARYASLERAFANGRGAQKLHLQSLARLPMQVIGDGLILNWTEKARDRYIDWSASLLQEVQVFAIGSFPVESKLRAGTDGTVATVCNRGDEESPPAFLHWRGANYEVPVLAPGELWTADATTETAKSSAQLRLLTQRSSNRVVTLLQRLAVPGNGDVRRAWLMTTEPDEMRAQPCRA